jgi:hypothetical protein
MAGLSLEAAIGGDNYDERDLQSATTMRDDLRSESNWPFEDITTNFCDMMGSLRRLSLIGYDGVADTVNQEPRC